MAVSEDFQAVADAIDRLAEAFASIGPRELTADDIKIQEINRRLTLANMIKQAQEMNIDISDL